MRLASITVATVLFAAWAAWADKVVTADQTYDNVKVLDFSAGALRVRDGKNFRKVSLIGVAQLTLDGEPLFTQAEELRAQGKFKDALAKYAQARSKAMKGPWHQTLARVRQEETRKLGGGASSRPGVDEDNPPEKKVDPLSSLDALGDDLATEPLAPKDQLDWKTLNEQEQKSATAKYQRELAEWKKKHSYMGVKVAWVMKVDEIKADPEGGSTLQSKTGRGFNLTADVAELDDLEERANDGDKAAKLSYQAKRDSLTADFQKLAGYLERLL